ncbi:MAG TPA: hypothetical protein VMH28_32650 [Candidatus Acidoferrales bacterium]|nr:hypothetical protein [Candidatus Acidoferrales bacterium]
MRLLRWVVLLGVVLYAGAWGYRICAKRYYYWLPGYVRWVLARSERASGPVHVFFLVTDHFEPGSEKYSLVQRWLDEYPAMAQRHRDSTGRAVQHTWFYPAEQPIDRNLEALKTLVSAGYGEVELHLHHGPDTFESARRRFQEGIAWFQRFGFLKGADGATHFAFIHGVWALDNSRYNTDYCGVNRELQLLRELGCFADFTFPSLGQESQPAMVNSIYMATDDDRPKSHNYGVPLQVGLQPAGDLLIFEGPLVIAPAVDPKRLFFVIDDGDVHPAVPSGSRRVDYWMRSRIHVKGRPDWQFIKVHCHSAQDASNTTELLGSHFDAALSHFEKTYNDGVHYVLHYVTAREAYNLARAAADGRTGDPRRYYDYLIPPYEADGRRQ